MMSLSQQERNLLRELGSRYMEAAVLPVQKEKINLWKALNRGEMQRPMVVIDQHPWNELNEGGVLTCQIADPYWRGVEDQLRKKLYAWENFPVDMVLDPFISIPSSIENSGYGISADATYLKQEEGGISAQHFENVLQDWDDVEKIQNMKLTFDAEQTQQHLEEAQEIYRGIAPVRASGMQFHLGVWDTISMLMGVEAIYYELLDRPEFMHAIMERFTSSVISAVEQANELGVHGDTLNTCHCSYIYTDELLPDSGAGKGPYSQNCWAFGLAQLFSSVSPEMTEEFELPYITRMAEYFGMIYYGCCDRLDDRLDIIKRIPHLKKVSCSPWSHVDAFAENIGPTLVMSNKPNPAFVATDVFDPDIVRRDLQKTYDAAKRSNVNLEFILKDISTVRHQPDRLRQWAEIAMEVACQ